MPISGCRASIRLVLSVQVMASSLTGAASFYAATAQQAIAAAVPPSPRPLKVVSWNTGPARNRGPSILGKLRGAGVAEEFDRLLFYESHVVLASRQWSGAFPSSCEGLGK